MKSLAIAILAVVMGSALLLAIPIIGAFSGSLFGIIVSIIVIKYVIDAWNEEECENDN